MGAVVEVGLGERPLASVAPDRAAEVPSVVSVDFGASIGSLPSPGCSDGATDSVAAVDSLGMVGRASCPVTVVSTALDSLGAASRSEGAAVLALVGSAGATLGSDVERVVDPSVDVVLLFRLDDAREESPSSEFTPGVSLVSFSCVVV